MSNPTTTDSQKRFLAVLLVAFGAILVWRLAVPAVGKWVEGLKARDQVQSRVDRTRAITDREVLTVRLEDLEASTGIYESTRNIFRYGER
ncbi:MAG: hypothetical protein MI919_10380, partial [Holophagales bacterium]|nr:hypothetical protein [Holophagales bacterium]